MKTPASWHPRTWYLRSVRIYLPAVSALCLLLAHTALHGTRYAAGVQGLGFGVLAAYILAGVIDRLLPGTFLAREAGTDELVKLGLNGSGR